jgi:hypothetical protein
MALHMSRSSAAVDAVAGAMVEAEPDIGTRAISESGLKMTKSQHFTQRPSLIVSGRAARGLAHGQWLMLAGASRPRVGLTLSFAAVLFYDFAPKFRFGPAPEATGSPRCLDVVSSTQALLPRQSQSTQCLVHCTDPAPRTSERVPNRWVAV